MPREADRVAEFSPSIGTGSMTLTGATPGHRTWANGFPGGVNVSVHYGITHDGNGTWETGVGTFLGGSNVLQRDLVLASSDGGSKVAFAAGDKIVYCQEPAETPRRVQIYRSTDIGLDIIPAASQSGAMIRVQSAGGGDALLVAPSGRIVSAGGLSLGSDNAPGGVNDLSRHLALWGTTYGFNVTSGRLNYNVGGAARHDFYVGDTLSASIGTGLLQMRSDTPQIAFSESDAPHHYRFAGAGAGNFYFQKSASGNFNDESKTLFRYNGEDFDFYSEGNSAARLVPAGTTAITGIVVMTREKGDARYQLAVSSASLKEGIQPLGHVDTASIVPRSWTWRMDGHPRNGLRGAGFVYEEIAAAFPEATYPSAPGRPGGIDALALLAVFVGSTREALAEVCSRLDALEAA